MPIKIATQTDGCFSIRGNLRSTTVFRYTAVMVTQPETNRVIRAFQQFSAELQAKHDKYERIVKISRDITIESKRLIFTIHSLPKGDVSPDAEALEKLNDRFKKLVESHFKKIALELENEDPFMYHRAYTWGVQEYVEALTYFHYVTESRLVGWEEVAKSFSFQVSAAHKEDSATEQRTVKLLIPLSDYILGIQDLTGEVMRLCITALGKGEPATARKACRFVQHIFAALHSLPSCSNEFYKKLEVADQSVRKMEYGCYLAQLQSFEKKSDTTARLNFPSHPADGS